MVHGDHVGVTAELVEFARAAQYDRLSEPMRELMPRALLDHVGCVVGGLGTELGRVVYETARTEGGARTSAILRAGAARLPAAQAAWVNGTAANALDFDDTLAGHPGCTVLPAVLAVGEQLGASGSDVATAAAVGYEVCARTGTFLHPVGGRYARVIDSATLQTFGTTLAVGNLLDLSSQQLHSALGIAAATAPLPRVRKDVAEGLPARPMLKSAWGWASHAAVRAALLAAQGVTGDRLALDGDMLIWESLEQDDGTIKKITESLGDHYLAERLEFKPYPSCRFFHPALDAMSALIAEHGFSWQEVEEIGVEGFSLLGDVHHFITQPASRSEAQFSFPFCLGAMVVNGELHPDMLSSPALEDERVVSVAKRVHVSEDPNYERDFPHQVGSRVRVRTADGADLTTDRPRSLGTPEVPMTDESLVAKFTSLLRHDASVTEAARLGRLILDFATADDVRTVIAAVTGAQTPDDNS